MYLHLASVKSCCNYRYRRNAQLIEACQCRYGRTRLLANVGSVSTIGVWNISLVKKNKFSIPLWHGSKLWHTVVLTVKERDKLRLNLYLTSQPTLCTIIYFEPNNTPLLMWQAIAIYKFKTIYSTLTRSFQRTLKPVHSSITHKQTARNGKPGKDSLFTLCHRLILRLTSILRDLRNNILFHHTGWDNSTWPEQNRKRRKRACWCPTFFHFIRLLYGYPLASWNSSIERRYSEFRHVFPQDHLTIRALKLRTHEWAHPWKHNHLHGWFPLEMGISHIPTYLPSLGIYVIRWPTYPLSCLRQTKRRDTLAQVRFSSFPLARMEIEITLLTRWALLVPILERSRRQQDNVRKVPTVYSTHSIV